MPQQWDGAHDCVENDGTVEAEAIKCDLGVRVSAKLACRRKGAYIECEPRVRRPQEDLGVLPLAKTAQTPSISPCIQLDFVNELGHEIPP